MKLLVVLPTYNEAENISNVLESVRDALPTASILVVDDNSPDATGDLAEKIGEKLGQIEVMRRPAKSGLGSAYRDGFRYGMELGYDAFVEMDSDFSHDPASLPNLVAAAEAGADVVIGSRYVPGGSVPGWSLFRRFISRGGNVYASVMLGLGVKDATAGYRLYRRDVLETVDLSRIRADSYGFQVEMTYRAEQAGFTIREVPIRFVDRELGTSKMSTFTVVEAFWLVTVWGAARAAAAARRVASSARRGARRGG